MIEERWGFGYEPFVSVQVPKTETGFTGIAEDSEISVIYTPILML